MPATTMLIDVGLVLDQKKVVYRYEVTSCLRPSNQVILSVRMRTFMVWTRHVHLNPPSKHGHKVKLCGTRKGVTFGPRPQIDPSKKRCSVLKFRPLDLISKKRSSNRKLYCFVVDLQKKVLGNNLRMARDINQ